MSDRQKLRVAIKEKKVLPKLSREDRNKKYQEELVEKPREQAAAKNLYCLNCKRKGHLFKDCPIAAQTPVDGSRSESSAPMNKQICYNCGSHDHALRTCRAPRHPDGKLPFASCFICKGTGHISKDCEENPNGLYPKGGGCLICSSKFHFAKDCPDKKPQVNQEGLDDDDDDDDDDEAVATHTSKPTNSNKSKRKAVEVDLGGDDDEFDFDVNIPEEKGHKAEEEAEEEEESQSHKKKKSKKH